MEFTRALPIPMTHSSKSELKNAVENDSNFLSSIEVVDYSLLVGFDKNTNTMRAGIIDYIQKYSWDKIAETQIKSYVLINKRRPTIINPNEYKIRFRRQMNLYFSFSPTQVTNLNLLTLPTDILKKEHWPENCTNSNDVPNQRSSKTITMDS